MPVAAIRSNEQLNEYDEIEYNGLSAAVQCPTPEGELSGGGSRSAEFDIPLSTLSGSE